MTEETTRPWPYDEYAHITILGKRYNLVYYSKQMDDEGNILSYIGPGNTRFMPQDVDAPYTKRLPRRCAPFGRTLKA